MKHSPEIEAIVRRVWSARARGDLEVLEGLWSDSEYLLIIGSDEHEWIEGARESLLVTSVQVQEWPIEGSELLRIRAFEDGSVGWAAFEERRTNPNGRSSIFRRTMVFVLQAGSWKIVQSHFSAPVPNLEAVGVDLTGSLSELVESIGSDHELVSLTGQMSGTVTLLFTDIVDSTLLSQGMGDITWSGVIRDHLETLRRVVEDHGGSVVKTLGDGGMYAFRSGSSALQAAIKIQQAIADSTEPRLQIRIGAHTGDVVQTEDDYLGSTVSKAARVAAAAEAGQILVSSTTAGLVSAPEFEFGAPIMVELKGLAGTHQLHPLVWQHSRASA
jgi:class 3 adenylate cyclase